MPVQTRQIDRTGISVRALSRIGSAAYLDVVDDGVGVADAGAGRDQSLGMLVIRNMVQSLEGELTCKPHRPEASRPGTVWRLTFVGAEIALQ